jgi:D-aminopeptidase
MAEVAELVLGSKRIDGRTLSYTSQDLLKVYGAFLAMITLAGTTA